MSAALARALLLLLVAPAVAAETVQPGQRWAWSGNAGWLDARPLDAAGPGLHAENGVVSGWMWSANAGWISAHCRNTDSCAEVDYGVHLVAVPDMPGLLRLAGYMWSENAGWIVTHCSVTQSCDVVDFGVHVDVASGLFDGYAWSQNLGWISFSCTSNDACAQQDYGVGLLPASVVPRPDRIFRDGFES